MHGRDSRRNTGIIRLNVCNSQCLAAAIYLSCYFESMFWLVYGSVWTISSGNQMLSPSLSLKWAEADLWWRWREWQEEYFNKRVPEDFFLKKVESVDFFSLLSINPINNWRPLSPALDISHRNMVGILQTHSNIFICSFLLFALSQCSILYRQTLGFFFFATLTQICITNIQERKCWRSWPRVQWSRQGHGVFKVVVDMTVKWKGPPPSSDVIPKPSKTHQWTTVFVLGEMFLPPPWTYT